MQDDGPDEIRPLQDPVGTVGPDEIQPLEALPGCALSCDGGGVFRRVGQAGDLGCLGGQRNEVVARELVDVPVAVRVDDRGELPADRLEETVDVPGLRLYVVAGL